MRLDWRTWVMGVQQSKGPGPDDRPGSKPPLSREDLREAIVLSLWAGQMLLQHGAETARVEETVHRLGTGLGCDWMDILVSPNGIVATTISAGEFRTKIRRVVEIGINMTVLDEINELSRKVDQGLMNAAEVRADLRRIDRLPRNYNRWLVALMVGLACGAFSRLGGGDAAAFLVTVIAAGLAMVVRQELTRHYFNHILLTAGTAFAAGIVASTATVFHLSNTPSIPLVSSVLLLVPGVPLINSAEDMIKGHMVTGVVRGLTGVLISLGIALGLTLAMRLMGVTGL